MSILFQIAARNVSRNRRRSLFTLLALASSVSILLVLQAFGDGVVQSALFELVEGETGALVVRRAGYTDNVLRNPLEMTFLDTRKLRSQVLAVPGVRSISPRLAFFAVLSPPEGDESANSGAFFVHARGVEPALETAVLPLLAQRLVAGSMPVGQGEALVNSAILESSGQPALAGHPWGKASSEEHRPALLVSRLDGGTGGVVVALSGHLGTGGGARQMVIRLSDAQAALALENQVTEYAVAVHDLTHLPRIRASLAQALGREYEVIPWDDLSPMTKDLLANQKMVLGFISIIFLGVVVASLFNTIQMTIRERTREVGTLLSIGIRRRVIATMFATEGLLLGVLGAAVGIVVGTVAVVLLNRVGIPGNLPTAGVAETTIRPVLSLDYSIGIFAAVCIISVLCTLPPALSATRMNPADASRSV